MDVDLVFTVAALYWLAPDFEGPPVAPQRAPLRAANALVALAVLAPLIADLVLGWNREFPFSGNSYFQVGQSYRIAFWWLSPIASPVVKVPTLEDVRNFLRNPLALLASQIVMLIIIAAVTAYIYRRRRSIALGFATIVVVAWGSAEATIFLRYPGARYLVDLPFLGPAFALNDLELAGRLSNVGAALCWLFVLRPWLIGRWPDLRILPVALLLLWHKDVIYYFDSVYLEPWGVVLSLLAVELLLENGAGASATACLLIGAAATVKEPFILALPFVWLAGAPWRKAWREVMRLTAAAVAAGVPFVIYYAARKNVPFVDMEINRGVHLGAPEQGFGRYAAEFAKQIGIAFPGSSGLLAIAALLSILVMLWLARSERRLALASMLAAACMIALIFVLDSVSQDWPGYFRFLIYSLPFLAGGVILLSQTIDLRWSAALAVGVALLQAPSAYTALARAAGPLTARNFVEHYDSPIVFPIKSLTNEARKAGALPPGAPIVANLVDGSMRPLPGSTVSYGPLGKLNCECESEHPNVLTLFVRFTNMSASLATSKQSPGTRVAIWQRPTHSGKPA